MLRLLIPFAAAGLCLGVGASYGYAQTPTTANTPTAPTALSGCSQTSTEGRIQVWQCSIPPGPECLRVDGVATGAAGQTYRCVIEH